MSLVGNALRMIILLQSRGKMKINELASEIEVNEKSIRRYKNYLEEAGIFIDSISGKFGGYRLYETDYNIGIGITDEEYKFLLFLEKHLIETGYIFNKDFQNIIDKIKASKQRLKNNENELQTHITKEYHANFSKEKERKYILAIREAIISNKKIYIKYSSISSGASERVIHPYLTFQNKGDMYFLGYCENKNECRDFKICRVDEINILPEKFIKPEKNIKDIMKNCLGEVRHRY